MELWASLTNNGRQTMGQWLDDRMDAIDLKNSVQAGDPVALAEYARQNAGAHITD
jgi:hypothetical protein